MAAIRSLNILGTACLCLTASMALGDSYRFQVSALGVASEGDYEELQENSYRAASLEAVVYLAPVEIGAGPWKEAAFINRSSYLGLRKVSGTLEREALVNISPSTSTATYEFQTLDDIDLDVRSAYGRYVFNGSVTTDLLVSNREETEASDSYEEDTLGLGLGSFVGKQSWWGLEYRRISKTEADVEHDVHLYGVQVHHLIREKDRLAVAIDYGVQIANGRDVDDAGELYADFTFYLSYRLGLEFGVSVRQEDARDISNVNLGAEYFFLPRLSTALHFLARQIDFSNSYTDYTEQGVLLELTGRF